VVTLFLVVTLLPNSLELLRKYAPALDFADEPEAAAAHSGSLATLGPDAGGRASAVAKLRAVWQALRSVPRRGVQLSGLTALIAALLYVLGVLALNASSAFVYGQF
jgi:hypothetical protein